MNLKPMNSTQTIKFINPIVETKTIMKSTKHDPINQIPNGIYKVIFWEKLRQKVTLMFSILGLIASLILATLYATIWGGAWGTFILPSVVGLLSLFKLMTTYVESKALKSAVKRYREDLKIGLGSVPPFISKLYINMHQKQIRHNWLTFFIMFYFGIFTLILWWLKNVSFWILEFDVWIKTLFLNPNLMVILFTVGLLFTIVIYIYMTIQRKKRILDIEAFFGSQVTPAVEMTKIKMEMNKFYRRIFILSVIIILVIPLFIKAMLRIFKK